MLVTGAGGFIGSHLVERLSGLGARVRAFVRYNSRGDLGFLKLLSPETRKSLQIFEGDLRDFSALLRAMNECDFVFHLGAMISIPYSYIHPREVIETNVIGTLNVLEAARLAKPGRVVHVSTSEVYGTARIIPIPESHPLQGQSPYSASKIAADKIAESYYRAFDVPVITVRPFNVYGPRQSARAVIPNIITQALTGDRVRLGAISPTRDFTFVDDTVRGFLLAAQKEGVLGREINLGSNREISIAGLVDLIAELVGKPVEIVCDEQRLRPGKSEVHRLHADNSLAAQFLDWKPSVPLREGLRRTIIWIKDNLHVYRIGYYQV